MYCMLLLAESLCFTAMCRDVVSKYCFMFYSRYVFSQQTEWCEVFSLMYSGQLQYRKTLNNHYFFLTCVIEFSSYVFRGEKLSV
jgi:hypothetical protein